MSPSPSLSATCKKTCYITCHVHYIVQWCLFTRCPAKKKLLTECCWSHSITSSRHPLLLAISTGLGNSSLVVSYKDLNQGQVLPSPKSCLWKKIWPHSTQFWLIVWAPAAKYTIYFIQPFLGHPVFCILYDTPWSYPWCRHLKSLSQGYWQHACKNVILLTLRFFIWKKLPKLTGIIILWLNIVLNRPLDTCAWPVCMRVNVSVSYSISLWFLVHEFFLFLSFLCFFFLYDNVDKLFVKELQTIPLILKLYIWDNSQSCNFELLQYIPFWQMHTLTLFLGTFIFLQSLGEGKSNAP